jgi:pimeloyl-ACP methyl ester carboxylesterase
MSHFKFEKFNILAHDRGARVAHRLALDHPGSVEKVVLLDIAPTLWMYEQTDMAFVRTPFLCSPSQSCHHDYLSYLFRDYSYSSGRLMRPRLVIYLSPIIRITSLSLNPAS